MCKQKTFCLHIIFGDPVIFFSMLPLANHLSKAFVVGNDYELEILLALSVFHDPVKCSDITTSNVKDRSVVL